MAIHGIIGINCSLSPDGGTGTLFVRNDGTEDLVIASIVSDEAAFSLLGETAFTLRPEATAAIPVMYTSSAAGKTVTVTADVTGGDDLLVSIDIPAAPGGVTPEELAEALADKEDVANKSTDTALGTSDTLYPSQKAVKNYVDTAISGLPVPMTFAGSIDCSGSPNFPAASVGHTYVVSVAGKIGGASGASVEVWDTLVCKETAAEGDFATVGSKWLILQGNLNGAVTGPSSATDGAAVRFDGTTGKLVKSSGLVIGDLGNLTLAGNDTSGLDGILMNPSAKTSGNFLRAQVAGGADKFSVNYQGTVVGLNFYANGWFSVNSNAVTTEIAAWKGGSCASGSTGLIGITIGGDGTNVRTGGTNIYAKVLAKYNQASGTAENSDFEVDRTETAIGSGGQYSQTWAVGGTRHSTMTKLGLLTLGVGVNKIIDQQTGNGMLLRKMTQSQYDGITPDSGTLYIIAG